ncbi:MAG: succinate dehydrogenase, hydrophobic membrane anchor protein [Rhodospirillaceae bacterium]|nr:succinate dehydrogenase, hydrophobic membrane anchor protein [Rhodospirillaceae bacterium]
MASSHSSLRSPLGRVRGLGSAKEGVHHWWAQRVTAVALVPLIVWFVWSILSMADANFVEFTNWLYDPLNATLMILFIVAAFHHAQLGLQVVIEDYVSGHGLRIASILLVKLLCAGLGALAVVSILIVTFGG